MPPKPPHFLSAAADSFRYIEKTNPQCSNLEMLTYGVYELSGTVKSGKLAHPGEEALLFCWEGRIVATVNDREYQLSHYDVLYIPLHASYQLAQAEGQGKIIVCRAAAQNVHPVYHAAWNDISRNEKRVRHLKGKDVFLMFDVSESADKLMAG